MLNRARPEKYFEKYLRKYLKASKRLGGVLEAISRKGVALPDSASVREAARVSAKLADKLGSRLTQEDDQPECHSLSQRDRELFDLGDEDVGETLPGPVMDEPESEDEAAEAAEAVLPELEEVGMEEVFGLAEAKTFLDERITLPLRLNKSSTTGVLLVGAPGTGKTTLAKALAARQKGVTNTMYLSCSDLVSRHDCRILNDVFASARRSECRLVVLDDVDVLSVMAKGSDEEAAAYKNFVLELAKAAGSATAVLGVTGAPWLMGETLLREFGARTATAMPSKEDRAEMLKREAGEDLEEVAADTEGYTGADLEAVVRQASLLAVRRVAEGNETSDRCLDDFRSAVRSIRPSVALCDLMQYEPYLPRRGGGRIMGACTQEGAALKEYAKRIGGMDS